MNLIGTHFLASALDSLIRCPDAYGLAGVLLAHNPSSLGRIPEQILQGRWIQIQSLLLPGHLAASTRQRVTHFMTTTFCRQMVYIDTYPYSKFENHSYI